MFSKMGSTVKSWRPFIVLREFIAGKHKVVCGSMGILRDGEQTRGRIIDLPGRPEVVVRKNQIRILLRRDAAFLYGIESLHSRLRLLANEKLFLAVCGLQISDVVRVRCKGHVMVGVAAAIWELTEKSGLAELAKLRIEVELLEGESCGEVTERLKVDAGDILTVSSSVQRHPYCREMAPSTDYQDNHYAIEDTLNNISPVPECDVLQKIVGLRKGIQGHYNSCYLDTTLFSLFTFSSVLDHILHSTKVCDTKVQRVLREDIVNPLRRNGLVQAENVMKLRRLLRCDTFVTEEKDPEEFLSALLHQVLAVDPLLKIRCNSKVQDSNSYQIIVEHDETLKVPTVQTLLERSFRCCGDLKFEQVPSCLILQMPRFGKKFKMFPFIVPSLELDISTLLYTKSKICCRCLGPAVYECSQCLADPLTTDGHIRQFCQLCEKQIHASKQMKDHIPRRIETQNGVPIQSQRLELLAVLCIKTSHFISFVKYGPGKNSWVFFDSMAGRSGNEIGTNIPLVRSCPQLGEYLSMSEEQFSSLDITKLDTMSKRFFSDIYMCVYQNPEHVTWHG